MKAKFNLSSITNLVAQHVEKAVLALVCLLALVLVWGGIAKSGGLDKEPAELATESANALENIDSRDVGPNDDIDWRKRAKVLVEELKLAKKPVSNVHYDHDRDWTLGLFDERSKRGVPPLYALEDLRATAGRGAVQMISPDKTKPAEREPAATRSKTLGQQWIVLTGAMPFAKQQEAYREAFKDSYQDPIKDVPSYFYYRVERAEVDPLGGATELQWKQLNVRAAMLIMNYWTGQQAEIVAKEFLAMPVTVQMAFPLPPVTNRQWGPEIAHEPDIPFYYEAQIDPIEEEMIDPSKVEDDPLAGPSGMRGRFQGRSGSSMMPGSVYMEEEMEMDMGSGMGSGMSGYGYRPGMRPGGKPITAQLFRFFDFNVVPGKHYRYRVRLMLVNPNKDVPPEYLARADLRKDPLLETEFSDPTGVVTVPLDSRLLCVNVKSSPSLPMELSSHMMSVRFDPETGDESAAEHDKLYRGQMLNFFDIPIETASAAGGAAGYEMMMGGEDEEMDMMYMMEGEGRGRRQTGRERRPRRDREPEEEVEKVDHLTRHIVLDFQGGQRLDRELTRPCSVLLLDPAGRLVVHSDLDDLEEYLTYYVPKEEPRKKVDEGMEGMYDMGGSMMMEEQ